MTRAFCVDHRRDAGDGDGFREPTASTAFTGATVEVHLDVVTFLFRGPRENSLADRQVGQAVLAVGSVTRYVFSMSAGLATSTVTPGINASDESRHCRQSGVLRAGHRGRAPECGAARTP
jgi:hypothetical protein